MASDATSRAADSRAHPHDITQLCYSGGGSGGWFFVGAVRALEQIMAAHGIDLSRHIQRAAGSSVGSMIALAHALRMSGEELEALAAEMSIACRGLQMNILDLPSKHGVISMEPIAAMVRTILRRHL